MNCESELRAASSRGVSVSKRPDCISLCRPEN